jgi:hypothetical protein
MKIGRNEKCPCGSNKKFKHCCLNPWVYENRNLLKWLRENDKENDYSLVTEEEIQDQETTEVFRGRKMELMPNHNSE